MAAKKLKPIHPGEVLQEEFMTPLGLSHYLSGSGRTRRSRNLIHHGHHLRLWPFP